VGDVTLGRGPVSAAASDGAAEDHVRDRDDRGMDPRDVFMRDLNLPRGPERELVHVRDTTTR
jgi:hypothetical protein